MPTLLIGAKHKRPNAPIELPNADGTFTKYFFRPVDPNNADSEHVAPVSDPAHQQRLLAIAEGYYISEAQVAVAAAAAVAATVQKPTPNPSPVPPPPAADTQPVEQSAPAPAPAAPTPQSTEDVTAAANALLALQLKAFKDQLATTSKDVLEAALKIEAAKLADDERPTYTKALQQALKA